MIISVPRTNHFAGNFRWQEMSEGFSIHILSARHVAQNLPGGSKLCVRLRRANQSKGFGICGGATVKSYVTDIGLVEEGGFVEWDYVIFVPVDPDDRNCLIEIELIQDACLKNRVVCSCVMEMSHFLRDNNHPKEYLISAKLYPMKKSWIRRSKAKFAENDDQAIVVNMTIQWTDRREYLHSVDEQQNGKKSVHVNVPKKSVVDRLSQNMAKKYSILKQEGAELQLLKHSSSQLSNCSGKDDRSMTDYSFFTRNATNAHIEDSLSSQRSQNYRDNNISAADENDNNIDRYYQESYVLPDKFMSDSESNFERWAISSNNNC
jgi:hypothetical protein